MGVVRLSWRGWGGWRGGGGGGCVFFFFKQKTAYEIGTGDWSSDVCSSDLSLQRNVPTVPYLETDLQLFVNPMFQRVHD